MSKIGLSTKSTKTAKKEVKKDEKALAKAEKQVTVHKQKKTNFWDFLGNAAKVAGELAPMVLPFLLAPQTGHAPTLARAASAPPAVRASMASAPLAAGGSLGNMVGLKSQNVTSRDKRGNISGMCVTCMDLVTALPDSTYAAGNVVLDFYLAPWDPIFQGSKFAEYCDLYSKFKVKKCVFIYEPTCPATTTGALCGGVFDDPSVDTANLTVGEGLRVLSAQSGSDTFQVWSVGMFAAPKAPGTPVWLFTETNGGTVRFTSAGKVCIVAAGDIAGGVSPGNLYMLSEIELSVPSLANDVDAGSGLLFEDTTTHAPVPYQPLTTVSTERIYLGGSEIAFRLSGNWTQSGVARVGNTLAGLPPGDYICFLQGSGSGLTGAYDIFVTDEATAANVESIASYGASNGTSTNRFRVISVPPDVPANTPVLGLFSSTGTTQTAVRFCVTSIVEGLFTGDSYPPEARAQTVRQASNCRVGPLYSHLRAEKFATTAEGQMKLVTRRLAAQTRMLEELAARDDPVPITQYSGPLSATGAAIGPRKQY